MTDVPGGEETPTAEPPEPLPAPGGLLLPLKSLLFPPDVAATVSPWCVQ